MKDRFTAIDVRSVVTNFRSNLMGMRVGNIYDINPRTYMIKLQETGKDKKLILIESGMRVHSTKYMRDIPKIPSIFTLKLRKHVRGKRLVDIRQLGIDRVIDFTFGYNEACYHIIIELHSKGNVILTDSKYSIITLLRTFKPKNSDILIATNHLYPVEQGDYQEIKHITFDELSEKLNNSQDNISIKQFLMKIFDFGTAFIQHCILSIGLSPNSKLSNFNKESLPQLYDELMKAESFTISAGEKDAKIPGWIIMRNTKEEAEERIKKQKQEEENENNKDKPIIGPIYDSFTPYMYKQFDNKEIKEFEIFDEAVDEYFSKIESQKIDVQKNAKASVVTTKLGKVKHDQTKRIKELENKAEEYNRKALLIQDNVEDVEKAIMIIRSAIANSIDWTELGRIVKEEKKNGDRIAEIIHNLKLKENQIVLMLSNIPYDAGEEELTSKPELVSVDISLSGFANVKKYFEMKKNAEQKREKTEASVNQALKAAQKKAERDIKQVKIKTGIQKVRKQFWFEKFYWFLSSDNYIIISGRDAQQNELIVKRYMQKGDLYVHADIHGASTCIIKNNSGKIVPPTTLEQAGQMAICRSAAWSSKVVTSAYWVYHHQVSKTAPTGEYLTTGSFMIRGKKNFLPPSQLIMGFGLLFRLDESYVSKHIGERCSKLGNDDSIIKPKQNTFIEDDDNSQFQTLSDINNKEENNDNENKNENEEDNNENDKDNKDNDIQSEEKLEKSEDEEDEEDEEEEDEESDNDIDFQPAHLGIPDKYKIDFSLDDDEDDDDNDNQNKNTSKKRISKRDRKLMKKGIDPSTVSSNNKQQNTQSQKKKTNNQTQQKLSRRQRSKMKKLKEKYKDQDEEERALRMKILGSAGKQNNSNVSEPDNTNDNTNDSINEEDNKNLISEEEQKKLEAERNKMKEKREESLKKLTNEAMSNISLLDELTGKPFEDDVLLCTIPMCGPYSAVKDYKFKVKLIPGTAKTGRAVQTSLNVFKHTTGITQQEKELITAMNDSEAMLQMLGGVTISTPGLSNLNKKKKFNKKKGKKRRN